MTRFWIILGLAACLAACSPDAPSEPPVEAPPGVAPEPASAAAAAAPLLNLAGEGVSFVDPNSGSARHVEFGADRAMVQQAVASVRGPPTDEGVNAECGAGPLAFATFGGGLTLWFQDASFAGWALGANGGQDLRTAAGLGIGTTRAELDSAYDATVEESTLGQEFQAGGMFGILSSAAPDGRVEALWAGVSCVFR
jgi:hypothetical protein